MFSKNTYRTVSFALVGCMFTVAWSEFYHGALTSDVHLITNVQLTQGSTVVFNASPIHENAITEAQYAEPPETSPLPHDGLIHPST